MSRQTPGVPRLLLAAVAATVAYLTAELADRLTAWAAESAPPPVFVGDGRWRAGIATHSTDTEEAR